MKLGSKKKGPKPKTKEINGVVHRLCSGRSHGEPTWLPENEKYFYPRKSKADPQAGQFLAPCRLCQLWVPGLPPDELGYAPLHLIRPFVIEGVHRVGHSEFARRINISSRALYYIRNSEHKYVKKSTAKMVMLEIVSMRRKEEVRHRDSIAVGATVRGLPEKKVKFRTDLYRPHGDSDAEVARLRKKNFSEEKREEIRANDRDRRRREREAKKVNQPA